jgi:hypothetical protein
MITYRQRGWLWLGLLLALAGAGCRQQEPTRWDEAQQESRGQPAVAREAEKGSSFNRFFPRGGGEYNVVYKQEKTGFAQASLKRGGKEVATLSVSDTTSNPEAAAKYRSSSEMLQSYPIVAIGSQGTGVLVADRFQVQVRSVDPSFSPADRKEWLGKFDLPGLAQLR